MANLTKRWVKDDFGKERGQLYYGPLPAGGIMELYQPEHKNHGKWRGWSMVINDSDGDITGWFDTADEARASVEKALDDALREYGVGNG